MEENAAMLNELCQRAAKRHITLYSRFLNLAQQREGEIAARRAGAEYCLYGGAQDCERRMLAVSGEGGKLSVAEPDDTREQAKLRRKAMKEASKQRNIYGNVAAPYLSAVRTIELYEGYNDLDEIISNYGDVVNERNARHERERKEKEATMAARALDREQRQQQKKLRKAK